MAAAALRFGAHRSQSSAITHLSPVIAQQQLTQKPRKIFRYSVIPGGAYSAEELAVALRVDPVAAAHYTDFDASAAAVRALPQDAYLYVSYRKADHVYWTAGKRRIPKGEPVLSDGKHLARTRCGNRLSGIPEFPIAYGPQPTELALNAPELPPEIEIAKAPLLAPLYDAPVLPLMGTHPREFAFPVGLTGASPIGEAFPAMALRPPFMVVASLPSPGVPGAIVASHTPPPVTPIPSGPIQVGISPEPSSATLIALGGVLLASLLALRRKRRNLRLSS